MIGRLLPALACTLAFSSPRAAAQAACTESPCSSRATACDTTQLARHSLSPRVGFGLGVLVLASTALDVRLRDEAATHQRSGLTSLASALDPLGRAGVLVPALVASVLAPSALGMHGLSASAARVGIGYAVSDAVESLLKPLVGRHRPSDGGGPWRFAPLRNDGAWHSFPSAHTVHAFSIATGIAEEVRSPWITAPVYGLAGAVGLQRIYTGAHWSSDVAASTALAVEFSAATNRVLRGRGMGRLLRPVPVCPP